jgi:hypothetical protein
MLAPKVRAGRLQRRALSRLCSPCCRPIRPFLDLTAECSTPIREPLQIIVITVISVMRDTFPDTYGVICMTVD